MIYSYALFNVIYYFRNAKYPGSIRSIAKGAKVGVATSKRCCDYLFAHHILSRTIVGRSHLYRLNDENVLGRHIKVSFSIAEIQESGLVEELRALHPSIMSIILFGSSAVGLDTPSSDLDILLITQKKIVVNPPHAERKLSRELSLLNYTLGEWRKIAITDKAFYERVIIGGISLYGELPVVV